MLPPDGPFPPGACRYGTYKAVQKMPGGQQLVAFTRILHRTTPDILMQEVGVPCAEHTVHWQPAREHLRAVRAAPEDVRREISRTYRAMCCNSWPATSLQQRRCSRHIVSLWLAIGSCTWRDGDVVQQTFHGHAHRSPE